MNKKITILGFILSLGLILFLIYFINKPIDKLIDTPNYKHSSSDTIGIGLLKNENPKSDNSKAEELRRKFNDNLNDRNVHNLAIGSDELYLNVDSMSMLALGLSKQASKEIAQNNIKYELTFNDINNPEEKAAAIKYYNDFKKKGYLEQSLFEIENILKTMATPYAFDNDFSKLSFDASKTGGFINSDYIYMGYSYEQDLNQIPADAKMQYLMQIM